MKTRVLVTASLFTALLLQGLPAQDLPRQGQGDRNQGRRGFGRQATGPLIEPEDLEFRVGVAAIPDRATFKKLSYTGPDVMVDTHLRNLEFVKFQIEGVGQEKTRFYFINTRNVRSHPRFMQIAGLARRARGTMRGVLIYRPLLKAPNGERGLYTFEFEPFDSFPFTQIKIAYDLLTEKAPILKGKLAFRPMPGAMRRFDAEKTAYADAKLPIFHEKDRYSGITFLPLNLAESFGRLRVMKATERPGQRDIVLYATLPNEMPRVAGIITAVRQTPLSHVNLRAIADGVPNAFVSAAATHEKIAPLIGKYVYYKVAVDTFEIREATLEEVEAHFVDLRPKKALKPQRDLRLQHILSLDILDFDDFDSFGVKAANLAVLHKLGFAKGTIPEGHALPFYFYDEFMKHNGFYKKLATMRADPVFQQNTEKRDNALAKFREQINNGKVPAWMSEALRKLQLAYPKTASIRCRSSTNNEDLPNFSGAGLYDSFTHHPDEGDISKSIKQVYASLWNFRAYEEREFYRIDHATTAMGVLVHRNYKGELANGVAVSDDIVYQSFGKYYINSQVGEDLITNPQDLSIPEEILLKTASSDRGPVRRFGGRNGRRGFGGNPNARGGPGRNNRGRPGGRRGGRRGGMGFGGNPLGDLPDDTLVRASNRIPDGKRILSSEQLKELGERLDAIDREFRVLYGVTRSARFSMEIEFKITASGKLAIKQARPWVYSR